MRAKSDIALLFVFGLQHVAACGGGDRDKPLANLDVVAACKAAFHRTKQPAPALEAARRAYNRNEWKDVAGCAALALDGPMAADANFYIGTALRELGDYKAAVAHLETAAALHRAAGKAATESSDLQSLSGVWCTLGDYSQALRAGGMALNAAERANDDRRITSAHLALADILREIGDFRGAELELEPALAARQLEDRTFARLQRGLLHIGQGHPTLARQPLSEALRDELAAPSPRDQVLGALYLNLSFLERKAGDFARALSDVEEAKRHGVDMMSYHLSRGLVYADMAELAKASADLALAEAENLGAETESFDAEAAWWIPFQRAEVSARLGNVTQAIADDHRAIAQLAKFALQSGVFGPTVIAKHRAPHVHLIELYAAEKRWRDAIEVIAMMDAQSLLSSKETAPDAQPLDSKLSPRSPIRMPSPDEGKRAVDAWRGRRLVIVVTGASRVWRIDVRDGEVTGSDVGDARQLSELARTLETDPTDPTAGAALGQAMLSPDLAPAQRVELLAVGPLARAPFAALRLGDRLAIARYPLVRAPGLLPRDPRGRPNRPAVVIGDPKGDLPAAALEARKLAAALKTTAVVGGAATRAAFAGAAGAELLHVAAHTEQRPDGATLELGDGAIGIGDIARLVPAPGLVVLASCGGAAGRDDAGNGSLTNAFLDAGADIVVATRWSVGDADAARFVDEFYRSGGAKDPVKAMAAAQLDSNLPAKTRAAFELFVARPTRTTP
jgi:tetratricopeptide (TPR) repeat protein